MENEITQAQKIHALIMAWEINKDEMSVYEFAKRMDKKYKELGYAIIQVSKLK